MYILHCTPYILYMYMHGVYFTLYIVQCTIYCIYAYIRYIVHYTIYNIHFIYSVYSVHCTVYSVYTVHITHRNKHNVITLFIGIILHNTFKLIIIQFKKYNLHRIHQSYFRLYIQPIVNTVDSDHTLYNASVQYLLCTTMYVHTVHCTVYIIHCHTVYIHI